MHSHLMFSESDLMTIHENLMKKYDAKTILKRQKILNDVFDKKNEVSISGEEEKVFLDDKEDKLQKSVDENDVSKNHEEDKVSLSDAEDKVTKGNHEGKISKNDNEDSARERDDGRARANKEMEAAEELVMKLNVLVMLALKAPYDVPLDNMQLLYVITFYTLGQCLCTSVRLNSGRYLIAGILDVVLERIGLTGPTCSDTTL
ncbi:hypothetical protein L195_g030681 [Trifolium pratense]|uniref:Uncharacterized protein n=1 Tax=Trifolium pratense TaxID=57577 RepID=A0A2K3L896_TRIPR|nr:hypothetical protein L195_g030681 [Trifolium pratense]